MSLNNGRETKSDIFPWDIFKSNIILHWSQNTSFIIDTFHFHCKIEHKQVKRKKNTWHMCKPDSIFPNLESSTLFK